MNMFIAFISSSIPLGVPLLYGSTGEIITEKSGHLNLGIPGIMYVGAISGVIGAFLYETGCDAAQMAMNPFLAILIPLLCAIAGSVLMGLVYSFLTVTLRANQNVTGLALTTFGIGLGNFFGSSFTTQCVGSLHTFAVFRRIEAVVERRGNRTRTDSVATDSLRAEFLRHGTGKCHYCTFRGCIHGSSVATAVACSQ